MNRNIHVLTNESSKRNIIQSSPSKSRRGIQVIGVEETLGEARRGCRGTVPRREKGTLYGMSISLKYFYPV